jgi:hypothetical protein
MLKARRVQTWAHPGFPLTLLTGGPPTVCPGLLLAQSAVDRLLNSAYELVLDGDSYRRRQKPRGQAPNASTEVHRSQGHDAAPLRPSQRLVWQRGVSEVLAGGVQARSDPLPGPSLTPQRAMTYQCFVAAEDLNGGPMLLARAWSLPRGKRQRGPDCGVPGHSCGARWSGEGSRDLTWLTGALTSSSGR